MAAVTVLALVMRGLMAARCATPRSKVAGSCVTLTALRPPVEMMSRVNPEPGCIMIHRVRPPHTRAMALRTVVGEQLRHVVRIGHLLKIRCMALIAVRIHELIVTVDMASLALCRDVRTCQWEVRRAMIERRRTPRTRRMALRTVVGKIERLMIWICRVVEVGSMTSITRRWQTMIDIVDVTL